MLIQTQRHAAAAEEAIGKPAGGEHPEQAGDFEGGNDQGGVDQGDSFVFL